ncbi:hypothetical protein ABBQ32_012208 [Trebouxia sp. C0010 RCD-2024]
MDEAGNSGDDPLSPRNTYTRQHSGHRQDRRQSDVERVLPTQHQQSTRTLTVPAQLAAAFPSWSREAADTLFGLLERGDNAQAAAISEAFSGVSFPAGLSASRPALSPQGGQHHSGHSLQQASALQHLQQHHLHHGLQRRNGDQTTCNETFVPPGTDTHNLLAQYQLQAQHLAAAPRPRWKPNQAQISLLEQHFNSGQSKPTPELSAAVQQAGSATEQQVIVWLKNRLARAKRDAKDNKEAASAQQQMLQHAGSGDRATESGRKRSRSPEEEGEVSEVEEQAMPVDFHGIVNQALRQTRDILQQTNAEVVAGVRSALRRARQVCCFGSGREGLALKAFATRLHQMDISASYVGDSCCAAVGNGDLVLISAGPTYYSACVSTVAQQARQAGAKIVAFTAHRTAPLPYADTVVRLPAQPTAAGLDAVRYSGSGSSDTARSQAPAGVLPPGSAYELALQLLLDTLAAMLQQENNVSDELMKSRLSNLE